MRIKLTAISLMLFYGLSLQATEAAVPKILSYQGVLKNISGSYLATGTYSLTFRLYNASSVGTLLWTEIQPNVSVSSGKFSVTLGSITAITQDFNADYWLSVQVGTDPEISSRTRLTSAAYNIRSDYENNGFTQSQHDALSHENIQAVKEDTINIAKSNFKIDAFSLASANSMSDMVVDTLNDATGIHAGSSANYTWRGTPDFDVTSLPVGGGVVKQNTTETYTQPFIGGTESYNGVAQIFRPTSQVIVDKATFRLQRHGVPAGNFRIHLYSVSSGIPGTLLAASSNIAASSIAQYPSTEEVTRSFSPVTLTANTDYIIAVENIDASGDGTNYVGVRSAASDVFTPGNTVYKNNSGVWTAQSTDIYFKVYEQITYSGTGTVVSNAFTLTSVPTEAMVIVDETLGSGTIAYSVSRDGTNFTSCAKETVTSLSAQPSGTQLKWKAVITGNAQLNAIAVAV